MSRRRHRGPGGSSEATARAVPSPHRYRAALIGYGRMGAFNDNEGTSPHAFSHADGVPRLSAHSSWWRCPTRASR